MTAQQRHLIDLYAAFNRRDIPVLLTAMTPDVRWANGWEGGTVRGRAAVRDYWTRQWQHIDPTVVPDGFRVVEDGRVAVTVRQTVRDKQGATLSECVVTHVYRFVDGLVAEMEIRDRP